MNLRQNRRQLKLMPEGVPKWVRIYDNGGGLDRFCRWCLRHFDSAAGEYCPVCAKHMVKADPDRGTCDRYTVVFTGKCGEPGYHSWTHMSGDPFDPRGVCMHGEDRGSLDACDGWPVGVGNLHPRLGRRITWAQLPADCQKAAKDDYKVMWELE